MIFLRLYNTYLYKCNSDQLVIGLRVQIACSSCRSKVYKNSKLPMGKKCISVNKLVQFEYIEDIQWFLLNMAFISQVK